jgi:DNA (cytosine-5)-methyltransferase 1
VNELALFAGAGGGILGGLLAGWTTVCAVERDAYAATILARRQDDGILAPFPIWSDVCSFDGHPWRGLIDVVSGGFPCQDISVAGKGAGIEGARSGLWSEFFRIICEVRPRFAYIENSPALTSRGLARVLADIASIGGDARWCVASAGDQGAWHERKRLWLVADFANSSDADGAWELQCEGHFAERGGWVGDGPKNAADADSNFQEQAIEGGCQSSGRASNGTCETADDHGSRFQALRQRQREEPQHTAAQCGDWWGAEPGVVRVVHGLAHRVDRIAALGNGQVPVVAQRAWERMMG